MEGQEEAKGTDVLNFPQWLVINTILTLFLLKVYFFITSQNQMSFVYLVSFVQDSFLLLANYFLLVLCVKKFTKLQKLQYITRPLFYTFHTFFTITAFIYTFFLFDLLGFSVNLFEVTYEKFSFFMEYFMNAELIIVLLSIVGFIVSISYFLSAKVRLKRLKKVPPIVGLSLTLLFVPTAFRSFVNPILYSIQEQIALSLTSSGYIVKLSTPVADSSKAEQFRFLNKAFDTIPILEVHYDRVVVLVMEGVNFDDFIRKSQMDTNSFLNRHKRNILSFTNYHTLNLDSYTSLLSILNSVFIPYQAYAINERRYLFVNDRNNLTRFFNANGFSTHFLTSYGEQQERFVPNIREWMQVKCMDNVEGNTEYASITSSKVEYACEDLAVFDDLMIALKKKQRVFVFQEMVYGHTTGWREKTGIETVDYYNRYFNKLVDELKKNSILDGTLIVITSDHGPRDDAYKVDNYHIPLILFATDLQSSNNDEFLSHLDFKDILLGLIANRKFEPDRELIYTIGHSGELVYGMITADGRYVFINNRMRHARGNASKTEIIEFNKDFQDYLNYFESLRLYSDKPK